MAGPVAHHRWRRGLRRLSAAAIVWTAAAASANWCLAAEVASGEALFNAGKYAECAAQAAKEIDAGDYREGWRRLKIESELAEGRYDAALASAEEAVNTFPASVGLRLLAHKAYLFNGQIARAATELDMIERFALSDPQRYSSAESRVALGRFFLLRGVDSRQALEVFYDPVVARVPDFMEAYLATAELALDKYDNALAAKTLSAAPETAQSDPRYHYLLARAFREDDAQAATQQIDAALKLNPRHVDTLLLMVDHQVDSEQYAEAGKTLEAIFAVNARHPLAWAYKAVLAHLAGDGQSEATARRAALEPWPTNPEVDHTIGRKLSEKYRFAEGAEYQRRALKMDRAYLPARMQLSQDLLRLGQENEGWKLADEVSTADGYNVVAHNLATLRDSLNSYRVLTNEWFRVRMEAREAAIYGPAALDLLDEARKTLCAKYEVTLDGPISVDIFAQQKDFAVRTFGLPGADGFLGVCFGNVITANSPAALGGASANWQAVLWHEFCHVVTLRKSRNKMPRWLSEGISVYEERQRDPSWGQAMTLEYRTRILEGEMTPVSQLSSAFLSPKGPTDLQFAYFESSLVVEYLVEKYGLSAIKALLEELGGGMPMDQALVHHVAPLPRLDAEFAAYATKHAKALAPNLRADDAEIPAEASSTVIAAWLKEHSDNFSGLVQMGTSLVREKKWPQAIEHASRLRAMYPGYVGPGNAYQILARAHRELADIGSEREALEAWAERDAEATDAYLRLMELGAEAKDWQSVEANAHRMLAVNPLVPAPHRFLAEAEAKLGRLDEAIGAYRALLEFDSVDPVDAHFRLAQLLHHQGDVPEARREVLKSLEEAPRFLAGHRLLLALPRDAGATPAELNEQEQQKNDNEDAAPAASAPAAVRAK